MVSINILKNSALVQSQLGASTKKVSQKAFTAEQKAIQKLFTEKHSTKLISEDFREFFCGNCELRNSYLNKRAKDSFEKEKDIIKGIL